MSKSKNILALNGFGIFLVVLGHSKGLLPEIAIDVAENDQIYAGFLTLIKLIYLFHMPFFFFVSGVLYYYGTSNFAISTWAFHRKKINRLLLPYFVISSITYPIKTALASLALRPLDFNLIEFAFSLIIPWKNSIIYFWFLPTLYLMMVISRLIFRKSDSVSRDVLIVLASLVTFICFEHENLDGWESFLNIGGVLHNYIYFASGAFLCKYKREFLDHTHSIFILLPFLAVSYFYILDDDLANTKIFSLIAAYSGIIAAIYVSFTLNSTLSYLGGYSYQIYLLSWFPQIFVRIIFGQIFFNGVWFSVILSLISGLMVPIVLVFILERYRIHGFPKRVLQY